MVFYDEYEDCMGALQQIGEDEVDRHTLTYRLYHNVRLVFISDNLDSTIKSSLLTWLTGTGP